MADGWDRTTSPAAARKGREQPGAKLNRPPRHSRLAKPPSGPPPQQAASDPPPTSGIIGLDLHRGARGKQFSHLLRWSQDPQTPPRPPPRLRPTPPKAAKNVPRPHKAAPRTHPKPTRPTQERQGAANKPPSHAQEPPRPFWGTQKPSKPLKR